MSAAENIEILMKTPVGVTFWPVARTEAIAIADAQGLRLAVDANGFWVRNWSDYSESFPTVEDAAKAYLQAKEDGLLDDACWRHG